MLHLKLLEKIRTSKTQNKQKERNNKIRAEMNEIETKKNHTKTQRNKKLFLSKNKQDWQAPGKSE
jgi:hypothetical protein